MCGRVFRLPNPQPSEINSLVMDPPRFLPVEGSHVTGFRPGRMRSFLVHYFAQRPGIESYFSLVNKRFAHVSRSGFHSLSAAQQAVLQGQPAQFSRKPASRSLSRGIFDAARTMAADPEGDFPDGSRMHRGDARLASRNFSRATRRQSARYPRRSVERACSSRRARTGSGKDAPWRRPSATIICWRWSPLSRNAQGRKPSLGATLPTPRPSTRWTRCRAPLSR